MNLEDRPPFHMFFYGTLKRGQRNHAYCRGALRVREATVRGTLYALPEGYPALVAPEEIVLDVGTEDPLRDARAAGDRGQKETPAPECPAVFGELYAFDDAEQRLPAIDGLEGFVPGDPESPYRRVLIPTKTGDDAKPTPAWAYVAREARGTRLPGGRWPY